jgi:hypothetical protein
MQVSIDPTNPDLLDAKTRKAEFRETAREILWKDRYDRKSRVSVDTGGAIARALEQAYKLGLAHAQDTSPRPQAKKVDPDAPVPWKRLSSRARSVLESILHFNWSVVLVRAQDDWSPDRWGCYWDWGDRKPPEQRIELAQTYSRATLAPLIGLGLMREETVGDRATLVPTAKGIASWRAAIKENQTAFPDPP